MLSSVRGGQRFHLLEKQELIEICASNLVVEVNVITRDKLVVSNKELNTGFFERTLSLDPALDPRRTFVRIVVSLFDGANSSRWDWFNASFNFSGAKSSILSCVYERSSALM